MNRAIHGHDYELRDTFLLSVSVIDVYLGWDKILGDMNVGFEPLQNGD